MKLQNQSLSQTRMRKVRLQGPSNPSRSQKRIKKMMNNRNIFLVYSYPVKREETKLYSISMEMQKTSV